MKVTSMATVSPKLTGPYDLSVIANVNLIEMHLLCNIDIIKYEKSCCTQNVTDLSVAKVTKIAVTQTFKRNVIIAGHFL